MTTKDDESPKRAVLVIAIMLGVSLVSCIGGILIEKVFVKSKIEQCLYQPKEQPANVTFSCIENIIN